MPPTFRRHAETPRLEMMPLLDVVFLLLTFFAFALLLMVRADVLDVELPVVEAGQQATSESVPVVVTVTREGGLAIDQERVDDADLIGLLEARKAETDDFSLLLEIDVGSPSGRLIELVQKLRGAGFERFGVLGKRPDPGSQPPDAVSSGASSAGGSATGSGSTAER